jgi:hypothetical protein
MEVVGGSIPLATTKSLTRCADVALRPFSASSRTLFESVSESRMLKFLGSTVGIIFLIGLVVVILLLKFIF